MKRLFLLPLLLLFMLAGCQTVGLPPVGGTKDVQAAIVRACGFLPTIQTVAALLGKNLSIPEIVSKVCAAVTTRPMAEGPGKRRAAKVAGVTIKGKFVR